MGLNQIKVDLCSTWGGDKNVAMAAWASSFDKECAEARTDSDVMRVISGVVHNHHDTPKERQWMEFFITCPIFVERQFDKYRLSLQFQQFDLADQPSTVLDRVRDFLIRWNRRVPVFSWMVGTIGRWIVTQNELSGRYRTIPDRPYTLPNDVAEIYSRADGEYSPEFIAESLNRVLTIQHSTYSLQLGLLKNAQAAGRITNAEYKRAREVLRGQLGTSYLTDMRIVCNMNAFEHIINQRLAKDAQMESRVVAFWMVKTLQPESVGMTLLEEMIKANGWRPLMDEVQAELEKDSS